MSQSSNSQSPRRFRFTKMHGIANDYVYVDLFAESLDGIDRPALAREVSDRYRGIGSDGLILITPPSPGVSADVRMEMYNADGSRGEMCGNGIRCVAKYAVETLGRGEKSPGEGASNAERTRLSVETDRGVLALEALGAGGVMDRVRVNMGRPILTPAEIPVRSGGDARRCVKAPLEAGGVKMNMTCVSMGNPHAVAFVEDVAAFELTRIGPIVERHLMFPNRVNFHVVQIHARGEATMRTWERGSGITQACGTGACAVLVAGALEGRLDRRALLHLPGGDLTIEWEGGQDDGTVFMTGPAEVCFTGEYVVR